MKFGKEFASQMVPEWQQAYLNYNQLKSVLKELQRFRKENSNNSPGHRPALKRNVTFYRAFSGLTRRYSNLGRSPRTPGDEADEEALVQTNYVEVEGRCETRFLMADEHGGEFELEYFRRLDEEFNKVNGFYKGKVEEVLREADSLNKQMDAFIAFRVKVEVGDHHLHVFGPSSVSSTDSPTSVSSTDSPTSSICAAPAKGKGEHMETIQEVELTTEGSENMSMKVMQETEEINVEYVPQLATASFPILPSNPSPKFKKLKPAPLDVLNTVTININPETPRSTLKGFLKDSNKKSLSFNEVALKKVEDKLKKAFIEFYQKLRILKSYSFLNILALSKILKKYDKIASRNASKPYLKMVDNSFLGSSDEVVRLMERVEATFIKHFVNANRSKGMRSLRPTAKREKHRTTFLLGFTAGCAIALVVALILIVRTRKILGTEEGYEYMENMFPLYSIFGFIVLHMLMYAVNVYFWRRYRVNYSFIFGFKQGTELGYREIFLLSSCLAVMALAGVLSNLDMEANPVTKKYEKFTELVPVGLVGALFLIAFCPFNIIFRSSRFFLIRCAFRCLLVPLYKVTLPDFFLADQLTSQVQTLRGLLFYVCYYGWGDFQLRRNTCGQSNVFKTFNYIIACIPYWMRFLQCIRRTVEESDMMQFCNALKYLSTIVAVMLRTAYDLNKGKISWKILAAVTSAIAAIVSTYWDLTLDWGLFQRHSKNRWLRDKLLVPSKIVYYLAIVLNVILRFAWLQAVLDFDLPFLHRRALVAIVASLEIIRRGIWNFFRLENEHLNNVEKYRAFKSVPLPFNYDENDDKDE